MASHGTGALPDLTQYDAVLFDLDGVLTPTAEVHMHAWRATFTALFAEWGITPEYTDADWKVLAEDMVFPAVEEEELDAMAIVPQKGDRVATATETFEVLAPAGAKVFSRRNGKMRIHSKQVSG